MTDRADDDGPQLRADWFQALAETAPVGIVVLRRGRFLYANPGASQLSGYPIDELLQMGPTDLVAPEDLERATAEEVARREGLKTHEPFEVRLRRADGEERWLSITIAPTDFDGVTGGLATAIDVTESKRAALELRDSRERLELAQRAGRSVSWDWQLNDDSMVFSSYAKTLYGVSELAVPKTGAELMALLPPRDREVLREALRSALSTREPFAIEHRAQRPDGGFLWLAVRGQAIFDENDHCSRIIGVSADITLRKAAEADLTREREKAHVTLRAIADGVIRTDAEGRVDYLNPSAEKLTGFSTAEAAGRPIQEVYRVMDEATGGPRADPVELCLAENRLVAPARGSVLRRRDGTELAIQDSVAPVHDTDGSVIGAVVAVTDLTRLRGLEREMAFLATHDPLTGLLNRSEFEKQLTESIILARGSSRTDCLCYMDLDDFKVVNDSCGHMAGDEMLRQLSGVLQSTIRRGDVLGRLGGDEFGVLLRGCEPESARTIANGLLEAVQGFKFFWEDRAFEVGASIGVVPVTAASGNLSEVLGAADTACYVAKDRGRNRIHMFVPGDAEVAARHMEMRWVQRLTRALEEDQFVLFHQPIVSVASPSETVAFEILLRLKGEDGEIALPSEFIPAAERYHLMPSIDRWVVGHALEAIERIPAGGGRLDSCFTVNLSGQSLGEPGFLDDLVARLQATDVPLNRVCFEITETAAVSNIVQARKLIETVRGFGCRFILDDFGSGMSSFAYLRSLPVDLLKIDGALIRHSDKDAVQREMITAIHRIGRVMDISTIGESVETEAVLATLKQIGVDFAQGYWVGRPTPLTDLR